MQLDRTNLRIIDLLQQDARMSIAELARAVNRAESTVRERVTALEQRGVIESYRSMVNLEKVGYRAHAILRASCDLGRLHDVLRRLETIPEVTRVLVTSGARPLLVEVAAPALADLEDLLARRFAALDLSGMDIEIVVRSPLKLRPVRLDPTFHEVVVRPRVAASPNGLPLEELETAHV